MKLLPAIILLLFSSILNAQPVKNAPNLIWFDDRPLNFGFLIGINTMNYKIIHAQELEDEGIRRYAEVIELSPGISLGMVTNFRINKNFSLRILPGISLGQRSLKYINESYIYDSILTLKRDYSSVNFSPIYLECPLIIKFNGARMMNAKPYFTGGVNFRYDLMVTKKAGMMLNPFDIYWEFGAGIDSYLTYFRLSTEFKISIGMFNVLDTKGTGEPYEDLYFTKPLNKLFSRIFTLTFYFE